MKRYSLYRLFWLLGIMLLAACQNSDYQQSEKAVSLQFTIQASERSLNSRGVEDLDDDGTVSEEEKIVDGRKMYRLAVFLLDGSKVVSSTVLDTNDPRFSNDKTEATVSFENLDYTKTYKLYAVANYGNYGELAGNLSDVNENNIASGLNVTASSANICNRSMPYPLTLTKDVRLMPGTNNVTGELVRTYARIRINIRNQSKTDLQITDFSLADRFTQKKADLFEDGGTADATPLVTSDNAVTPFVQDMIVAGMGEGNSIAESTLFDTYMLESNGGQYQYTLGLKYGGGVSETVYTVDNNYISNPSSVVDGGMYIIYNTNARRYLYDNGSNTLSSVTSYMTGNELIHNCVWRFIKTSGNNYRIESMGRSGYYIKSSGVKNNTVPMTSTVGNNDYFTLSQSSSYMHMKTTSSNYYLAVNNNGPIGASTGNSRRFRLYRVNATTESSDVEHEATIPINIIDKETGESVPMQSIKRNDFINIMVSVTYNEKTGQIEFEVSDWDEVNGDVTFD